MCVKFELIKHNKADGYQNFAGLSLESPSSPASLAIVMIIVRARPKEPSESRSSLTSESFREKTL